MVSTCTLAPWIVVVSQIDAMGLPVVAAVGSCFSPAFVSPWSGVTCAVIVGVGSVVGVATVSTVGVGSSILLSLRIPTAYRTARTVAPVMARRDPMAITRLVNWVLTLRPSCEWVDGVARGSVPADDAGLLSGPIALA